MEHTSGRNVKDTGNCTQEYSRRNYYHEGIQYQLINLNPNESCYVSSEDNTLLKNAHTQILNNTRNNTEQNERVHIINVKELSKGLDECNKTMCFTHFSTVSYYTLATARIDDTISCNLQTEKGDEHCMCMYTQGQLQVNQTVPCLCYESKVRKHATKDQKFERTYFGRNCTVLAQYEKKNNEWLFRCALYSTPSVFEHVYFNISFTEFPETTTSQKSMETSNLRTQSNVSNHRIYNVSTFLNSTAPNETLKNISKRSFEILSSLTENTHTRISHGLHYGKQEKLIGSANSDNCTLTSNPITLLLFLFVQLFVYYGFLRKEYLQMHKKRR